MLCGAINYPNRYGDEREPSVEPICIRSKDKLDKDYSLLNGNTRNFGAIRCL